jgi:hypothetical protein
VKVSAAAARDLDVRWVMVNRLALLVW